MCKNCQEVMRPVEDAICPMCERRAIDGATHSGCQTRYSLDGLISFYRYDGPVRSAIKRLKYKPYLADLAEILVNGGFNNVAMQQFNNFLTVPVPLHPQRERERGFNQATIIGKAIDTGLSLQFQDKVLKRTRYTKPQVVLKGDERRKNLADAFVIASNILISQYPNILLVDDVWTTGSTMRACANVLKRAGAKRVWAITVAR